METDKNKICIDKNKIWLIFGIGLFVVFIGFLVWNSVGSKEAMAGKARSYGAVGIESICYDNVDNDKDGWIDCADANCNNLKGADKDSWGCTLYGGCFCQRPESNCADGFDNDRDGSASLRTIGEMELDGVIIVADGLYVALEGISSDFSSFGIMIYSGNFQEIIEQIGVEVPELTGNCLLLGCWMVYLPGNEAVIVSEAAMVVIDTFNFKSYPTTDGVKTLTQINTAVLNVGTLNVDIAGNDFNLGDVAGGVESGGEMQVQQFQSDYGSTGMVTASSSGADCDDEDCDSNPLCGQGVDCALSVNWNNTGCSEGTTCDGTKKIVKSYYKEFDGNQWVPDNAYQWCCKEKECARKISTGGLCVSGLVVVNGKALYQCGDNDFWTCDEAAVDQVVGEYICKYNTNKYEWVEACVPQCTGKQCGPDGCGGVCGTCPVGNTCGSDGKCSSSLVTCVDPDNTYAPYYTANSTINNKSFLIATTTMGIFGGKQSNYTDSCFKGAVREVYCNNETHYSFNLFTCPGGTYCANGACPPATTVTLGDVNGQDGITSFDAVLVLRHVVGESLLSEEQIKIANVNYCQSGQEELNAFDAVLILRKDVGEIAEFPCK